MEGDEDGWMNGLGDGWIDGCLHAWVDGMVNGWMNRQPWYIALPMILSPLKYL